MRITGFPAIEVVALPVGEGLPPHRRASAQDRPAQCGAARSAARPLT